MIYVMDQRRFQILLLVLVVIALFYLVRLPFLIIRGFFRWIKSQFNQSKRQRTDYGYNTIYDNNRDRWEYNEKKRHWEPKDKTRMVVTKSKKFPQKRFRADGYYWDEQKQRWISPDYKEPEHPRYHMNDQDYTKR